MTDFAALNAKLTDDYAIKVEQVALGAMLDYPDWIDRWELCEYHFIEPLHQQMYEIIRDRHAAGQGVSVAILCNILADATPVTADLSVPQYVQRLRWAASRELTPGIGETVKDLARRRCMANVAQELAYVAGNRDIDVGPAIAQAIDDVSDLITDTGARRTVRSFESLAEEVGEELRTGQSIKITPTGLIEVDKRISGFSPQLLYLLAGRPSMGKSMIGWSMALKVALRGHGVMGFSLEMTSKELAYRIATELAYNPHGPIEYNRALRGDLTAKERAQLQEALAHQQTAPLVVDDKRGLTMPEIAARVRKQKRVFEGQGIPLELVIIDHLGLVRPSGRYAGDKVNEIGEVSSAAKTLAKELDVAVLGLQQLNRRSETSEDRRPTLANLRGSGDLEQDADVVMLIHREAYYLEREKHDLGTPEADACDARLKISRNVVEIFVAKNRNGPVETFTLFCDPGCNVVSDPVHKRATEAA